jgi:hypothetical protein
LAHRDASDDEGSARTSAKTAYFYVIRPDHGGGTIGKENSRTLTFLTSSLIPCLPLQPAMHRARQATNGRIEPSYVKLPGRDPTLARLFIVQDHPQRAQIPSGTTYVYYQDTSQDGLRKTWDREKKREIPQGNLAELLAAGAQWLFFFLIYYA